MPGSDDRPLPERDLDHVLAHTQGLWEELRGGRLFVTGGTGFFGRWMLESFLHANDRLDLGAEAIVLTRDPQGFAARAPHVTRHPAVTLHEGDVRTFEDPAGTCTHILHMATETDLAGSPAASFRTAVEGTERVLGFAGRRRARKILLTSSGAVYGTQPPEIERLAEDFPGAPRPEDLSAGYGHGKRAAEFLCVAAAADTALEAKIARCFAFVGPHLPLDANFAIGNFIRDALWRDRIEVAGDGTPRRSYLYAADLAVWLWTILFRGEPGRPYNVGSEADLSIAELAHLVARELAPGTPVRIAQQGIAGASPARYVPATVRAARDLNLCAWTGLEEAVRRTGEWYLAGPMRRRQA
jgi:nucleoside-diphosphate-sugar epimerase